MIMSTEILKQLGEMKKLVRKSLCWRHVERSCREDKKRPTATIFAIWIILMISITMLEEAMHFVRQIQLTSQESSELKKGAM